MRPRAVLLLALAVTPALAGCLETDVGAWWDREAVLRIHLAPLGPAESDVERFRSLRLVVWSVAFLQAGSGIREFYFDPPLNVSFVEAAREGMEIPLVEARVDLRAVREVAVRVTVNESRLVSGAPLTGCYQGVPHPPPCVRVAARGVYTIEEPALAPERGRTSVYVVPMGVHFHEPSGEFYVRTEVARIRSA